MKSRGDRSRAAERKMEEGYAVHAELRRKEAICKKAEGERSEQVRDLRFAQDCVNAELARATFNLSGPEMQEAVEKGLIDPYSKRRGDLATMRAEKLEIEKELTALGVIEQPKTDPSADVAELKRLFTEKALGEVREELATVKAELAEVKGKLKEKEPEPNLPGV